MDIFLFTQLPSKTKGLISEEIATQYRYTPQAHTRAAKAGCRGLGPRAPATTAQASVLISPRVDVWRQSASPRLRKALSVQVMARQLMKPPSQAESCNPHHDAPGSHRQGPVDLGTGPTTLRPPAPHSRACAQTLRRARHPQGAESPPVSSDPCLQFKHADGPQDS